MSQSVAKIISDLFMGKLLISVICFKPNILLRLKILGGNRRLDDLLQSVFVLSGLRHNLLDGQMIAVSDGAAKLIA
jgi:hypothetical protein